jgi:hypothetical protein
MRKNLSSMNKRHLLWLAPVVCLCVFAVYAPWGSGLFASNTAREMKMTPAPTQKETTSNSKIATPTIDIDHARQVFQAGGELTYDEVVALRLDIVGAPPRFEDLQDNDKYRDARAAFEAREERFAEQLKKCILKETVGWLAGWYPQRTDMGDEVPGITQIAVYMYDPYSEATTDCGRLDGGYNQVYSKMYILNVDAKQVILIPFEYGKPGQRIRFSGELTLDYGIESVTNAHFEVLEDGLAIPTPTDEELKDFQVVLERFGCFGTCPVYSLTITGDGRVTFEGKEYTRVKGTATAKLDKVTILELVREVKKADVFDLLDIYDAHFFDIPVQQVSVQMGGKAKRIKDFSAGPPRLNILENRIDQIASSYQWIR